MVKTLFELWMVIHQIIALSIRYGSEYKLDTLEFRILNLSQEIQQMNVGMIDFKSIGISLK